MWLGFIRVVGPTVKSDSSSPSQPQPPPLPPLRLSRRLGMFCAGAMRKRGVLPRQLPGNKHTSLASSSSSSSSPSSKSGRVLAPTSPLRHYVRTSYMHPLPPRATRTPAPSLATSLPISTAFFVSNSWSTFTSTVFPPRLATPPRPAPHGPQHHNSHPPREHPSSSTVEFLKGLSESGRFRPFLLVLYVADLVHTLYLPFLFPLNMWPSSSRSPSSSTTSSFPPSLLRQIQSHGLL